MFSLKKSIGIMAGVLILGVIAGFNIGKFISKNNAELPERLADSAIEKGAADISRTLDVNNRAAVTEHKEQSLPVISAEQFAIVVNDQDAGGIVSIANIIAPQSVWVAIHEDRDGQPGKILGARLFDTGTHTGQVELLRNTESNGTYYAVLHKDNGGRVFDYTKNIPIKDVMGHEIVTKFSTGGNSVLHQ